MNVNRVVRTVCEFSGSLDCQILIEIGLARIEVSSLCLSLELMMS